MKKFIFCLVLLIAAQGVNAATGKTVSGKVGVLRNHTLIHEQTPVKGFTVFQLDAALVSPCTWLYIAPEDKASLSFLISSKAQNNEVRVYYYTDVVSPWSTMTCAVYAIDLL
ncbi:hypothetical protein [Teredinibacter sp. KSP-S5-2]|uniref:hypothetical protein n=1 Tax=Teredinibacter sp. KSP-S5-2 TaxID=3034506 RepID=UPI00293426C5|nr:hypothetical protein [Teredinibacter sp. KSP-S5-2]WNO10800.1 hypothetical protein P5V12_06380 [Teredinibacter sp. KSP-S5-2]